MVSQLAVYDHYVLIFCILQGVLNENFVKHLWLTLISIIKLIIVIAGHILASILVLLLLLIEIYLINDCWLPHDFWIKSPFLEGLSKETFEFEYLLFNANDSSQQK